MVSESLGQIILKTKMEKAGREKLYKKRNKILICSFLNFELYLANCKSINTE